MERVERSAAQPPGIGRDVMIAGISTLGSIAVALIAILPQLRKSDGEQIAALKTQVAKLCQAYGCEGQAVTAWTVHGSVRPTEPGSRAADYEVYLVPTRQVQTTRDDGSFFFEDVPPGSYAIVARELESSGTVRGAVNRSQSSDTLTSRGARLDYRLLDPQRTNGAAELAGHTALASAAGP